jgi:hypothetical protein
MKQFIEPEAGESCTNVRVTLVTDLRQAKERIETGASLIEALNEANNLRRVQAAEAAAITRRFGGKVDDPRLLTRFALDSGPSLALSGAPSHSSH